MSLTGGHHFLYDTLRPHIGPTRWFGGHTGAPPGCVPWLAGCPAWSMPGLLAKQSNPPAAWPAPGLPRRSRMPPELAAVASFYVKAGWSPDGTHILSGSTDRNVYIWEVGGG